MVIYGFVAESSLSFAVAVTVIDVFSLNLRAVSLKTANASGLFAFETVQNGHRARSFRKSPAYHRHARLEPNDVLRANASSVALTHD